MFNEQILTEKLRYLITTDAKNFEILAFNVSFSYDSWTNPTVIEEYDVDIEFDYNGTIESDADYMGRDISKLCNELGYVVGTYGIEKNGKFNARGEHKVFPAMIWNIKFSADETHIFNVTYKVIPNE